MSNSVSILITGASGGIGRAIAMGAAERRANVLAVARSSEKLAHLAKDAGKRITTKLIS